MVSQYDAIQRAGVQRSSAEEPNVSRIAFDIMHDAELLGEQQFALLRRELKDELCTATAAVKQLAAGLMCGVLAGVGFTIAASLGVQAAFPQLPPWASFVATSFVLTILSVGLLVSGTIRASSVHVLPPLTLQTFKENLRWLTAARR